MPSSTVLSGADSWITVDAAVGNDKFHFNHAPLRLDGLAVTAPDGSAAEAENLNRGKLRSTFDLQLKQSGTYRVAVVNDGVFARWKEDGKPKRYFGKPEGMAQAVPAKADELEVSQSLGRVETFVTAGKPSAVKPVGRGLELAPVTHPNDLYAGETATFQMLLDGQPAPDLEMTIVAGGIRYRDQVGEIKAKTDKDGKFSVMAAAGPVLGRGRHGRRQGQRAAGQEAPPVLRRHLRSAQALIRLKAQAAMSAPCPTRPGAPAPVARGLRRPALAAGPAGRRAGGRHHGHHLVGPAGAARGLRRNLRAPGHPGRAGRGGGRDEHLGRPQRHHPLQPRRPWLARAARRLLARADASRWRWPKKAAAPMTPPSARWSTPGASARTSAPSNRPRPPPSKRPARCGWRRVKLDPERRAAWQEGGTYLDLSSIAKGHGVDRAAQALDALGATGYLVEVGGELRARGLRPDGQPWRVAVEVPDASDAHALALPLRDLSIATSGDYRRHAGSGDARYAHTIDPRDGQPVRNGVASVTVLHADCMQADALATALTVLGETEGLDLARRHGLAALFILREAGGFRLAATPAFQALAAQS